MTNEFSLLLLTTVLVAFTHTLTGPDHYLPFIVISKAKKWSFAKTLWFTTLCGLGHVGSSVLLGLIGIAFGIAVGKLNFFEAIRGSIISWIFTAFGFIYMIWGIWRITRNKPHKHLHIHSDEITHEHEHTHLEEQHVHIHEQANITPWILFIIFVFGPCEPLIPIVMYPAAKNNYTEMIIVTIVFSLITILTMLTVVFIALKGINLLPMKSMEKYTHVLAGGTIFLCGLGMLFLGL
ncbi:MAG: sulfite exporter TauE/SafE family protein [Bacteroidota bacterium]